MLKSVRVIFTNAFKNDFIVNTFNPACFISVNQNPSNYVLGISSLVDGGFTLWTTWTTCSVTCGDGTRSRSRLCTNPEPQHGGLGCVGDATKTDVCNDAPCPSNVTHIFSSFFPGLGYFHVYCLISRFFTY